MIKPSKTAAVFASAAVVLLSAFAANAADRPNVVLMMADDLGYQDLSCYGSETIRTPELDKLASQGIRLTSFYAGGTVCTPSRMALLTGAYPTRVGWPGQRRWASSKPFRGLKWSSLEGGTRAACIIRWPGAIPAQRESDELTAAIDLLPTLAHACGIDLHRISKATPKIDGVNVWSTLTGKKDAPHARTNLLYWNGWAGLEAIRVGQWKLFLSEVKEVADSDSRPLLIHLTNDPAERTNLAQDHPEKVEAMQKLAETLAADIEANSIPLGGPPSSRR